MRRRSKQYEHPTLFISGNVAQRVPLFRLWREANQMVVENLDFYRSKYGFLLYGYVVMPDHYHVLVRVRPGTSLIPLLRDFKSAVGKQVVEGLARAGLPQLLERFRLRTQLRRSKDARFRILQADNDIVEVFTPRILRGKLEYMHNNPVKEGLVARPDEWMYSSCRAYEHGIQEPIRVDRLGALDN